MPIELLSNVNLRPTPTLDDHVTKVLDVRNRITTHNADATAHQSAFNRHNTDPDAHPDLATRGLPEIIPLVLFDRDENGNFYRRADGLGGYVCVATPNGGFNLVSIITLLQAV